MGKGKQAEMTMVISQGGVDIPLRLDDATVAFAERVANGCTNVTKEQVFAVWFVTRLLQMPPMHEERLPAKKATKRARR